MICFDDGGVTIVKKIRGAMDTREVKNLLDNIKK